MAVGWRGNLPSSPALPPPEAGAGRTRGELQAGFRPSPDARSQTTAAGQAGLRGAPRPGRLPEKAPAPHPARPPPTAPGEDRGPPQPRAQGRRRAGQQPGPPHPGTAARPSTESPARPQGGGRARCPAQASGPVAHMAAAAAQASGPAPPRAAAAGSHLVARHGCGRARRGAGGGRSGGPSGTRSAVTRDRRARLLHQRSPPPQRRAALHRACAHPLPAHARRAAAPAGSCRFRSCACAVRRRP